LENESKASMNIDKCLFLEQNNQPYMKLFTYRICPMIFQLPKWNLTVSFWIYETGSRKGI